MRSMLLHVLNVVEMYQSCTTPWRKYRLRLRGHDQPWLIQLYNGRSYLQYPYTLVSLLQELSRRNLQSSHGPSPHRHNALRWHRHLLQNKSVETSLLLRLLAETSQQVCRKRHRGGPGLPCSVQLKHIIVTHQVPTFFRESLERLNYPRTPHFLETLPVPNAKN